MDGDGCYKNAIQKKVCQEKGLPQKLHVNIAYKVPCNEQHGNYL